MLESRKNDMPGNAFIPQMHLLTEPISSPSAHNPSILFPAKQNIKFLMRTGKNGIHERKIKGQIVKSTLKNNFMDYKN